MNRLTDHLIVISFDCLSALDFPVLQKLPHFSSFMEDGVYCTNVQSIYPSVTYPCHSTIVTGNYPARHGVISNTLLQPGKASPDWNWYRSAIKGTTLFDEAKRKNLKTAALLWPVTGKADIDYNMPEIFANRPWSNQVIVSLMNGSPLYQIELNHLFGHLRKGLNQPELDDFVLESAVHTIKTKQPNLLMIHFTDLDSQRHYHGFSSLAASDAIHRHDVRLGRIIAALKEQGIYENSTIVALGDHSALDEKNAINLNVLFHEHNLITLNHKGKVKKWTAFCKSCDGSAYIYVKDKQDVATINRVHDILLRLMDGEEKAIERIFTAKEAEAKGADPSCAFMIEASKGFYFLEDIQGAVIKAITDEDISLDKKYTKATHGYSPEKDDYSTIFMASGKGIRRHAAISSMRLIDEGPTMARILGVDLGDTDGVVLRDMLEIGNK